MKRELKHSDVCYARKKGKRGGKEAQRKNKNSEVRLKGAQCTHHRGEEKKRGKKAVLTLTITH